MVNMRGSIVRNVKKKAMKNIKMEITYLQNCIYEGLKTPDFKDWPELFSSSIKEHSDLSMIWPKFAIELLSNDEFGALKYVKDNTFQEQSTAINNVLELFSEWVTSGNEPSRHRWAISSVNAANAASAANTASAVWTMRAQSAKWAAKAARKESAVKAEKTANATWTAADASVMWVVSAMKAASTDREDFWLWARDTLVQLLKEAPINE